MESVCPKTFKTMYFEFIRPTGEEHFVLENRFAIYLRKGEKVVINCQCFGHGIGFGWGKVSEKSGIVCLPHCCQP